MSEFRVDPIFGHLCIVARERASRPRRMRAHTEAQVDVSGPCPLCPGNEALCPPEIARVPESDPRWQSRAFANRYPILALEAEPVPSDFDDPEAWLKKEPLWSAPGFGVHEIVVDSPSHHLPFWAVDPVNAAALLRLIQRRIQDLYRDRRILYLQVFKNHGVKSGGSLDHPHFQLVGLSFIPASLQTLLSLAECRVCIMLKRELAAKKRHARGERLLAETARFVALADFAPTYPYQFSVYPKTHRAWFDENKEEDFEDLSQLLSLVLGKMSRLLGEFDLNMVLFHSPNPARSDTRKSVHGFFRVYPRVALSAGFELATGIPVIHVAPEDAARSFKEKGV